MIIINEKILNTDIRTSQPKEGLRGVFVRIADNKVINVATNTRFLQTEILDLNWEYAKENPQEYILPIGNLRRFFKFGKHIARNNFLFSDTKLPDGWLCITRAEYEQWCKYCGIDPYINDSYSDFEKIIAETDFEPAMLNINKWIINNALLYSGAIKYIFFRANEERIEVYGAGGELENQDKVLYFDGAIHYGDISKIKEKIQRLFIPIEYLRGLINTDTELSVGQLNNKLYPNGMDVVRLVGTESKSALIAIPKDLDAMDIEKFRSFCESKENVVYL